MNYLLVSDTGDGYMNLARDEHILNTLAPGDRVMYLYVNARAVVIGRNQNPWRECDLKRMEADGVQLIRRVSGGGAVYHDQGNLNFSFICARDLYDEREQTGIILDALDSLGARAEVTGRNDIAIDGKKFSGNAYCARAANRQRHGTLLINSDLDVFDKYLNVPKQKLIAKGVASVKSRVCNLREYVPGLSVDIMADALKRACARAWGDIAPYTLSRADATAVQALCQARVSWQWRMGEAPHFDYIIENRFEWGMAQLCLTVEDGYVQTAKLYTDALDTSLPARIEPVCAGARFDIAALAQRLKQGGLEANDIAEYLQNDNH